MQREVSVRVLCSNPPLSEATQFGLQGKTGSLHAGVVQADGTLIFEGTLKVRIEGDKVSLTGNLAHGSSNKRFLYLTLRALGTKGNPQIIKRIKVQLGSISATQIEKITSSDAVLQVAVDGRGAATVPLLDGGWKVVSTA